MKQASAIISVILAIVVLLAAFGVSLGIREIRARRAASEPKTAAKTEEKPSERSALPGGGAEPRTGSLSVEERAERQDERAKMRERWENMSDEERKEYMAQRPGGFGGGQRGDGRRPALSEERRAQMEQMRERWESMSEEEREESRAQMRERGGRRRGGGGMPPDMSPEERAKRREEAEMRMREEQEMMREDAESASEN